MASKVDTSSFQKIAVSSACPIKKLLESNKLKFEKGKAFYEMTKSETIQDYKKLVVMRKSDGAMVTGEKVREVLNIPKTKTVQKFKLDLEDIPDFKVFVQSTSHNRVLMPDTTMLFLTGEFLIVEDDASSPAASPAKPTALATPAVPAVVPARASKRLAKTVTDIVIPVTPPAKAEKRITKAETEKKAASPPKKTKRGGKKEDAETEESVETPADVTDPEPITTDDKTTKATPSKGPSLVEIVFSFDTTGSMYPCLGEVRRKLTEVITRLKRDVPGIRMAIIAHGDYCDRSTYITKILDFTEDQTSLCKFVRDVGPTGGGDYPECYELVLRESHTKLNWTPNSQRSLVMIGDAPPHESNYPLNTQKIDWKEECAELKNKNIRIYSVQALNNSSSSFFYQKIADLTGGYHLHLDQFSSIANFMLAICYREVGDDSLRQFEEEIEATGMNRELHRLFDNLAGRSTTFAGARRGGGASTDTSGLTPVNPSRFQVLKVDNKMSIKDFVQMNSLVFKTGRGFYEFTKSENISHKKEVVLIEKMTGDMFTGPEACRLIGAGGTGKIKPTALDEFRVFVQSTSYNRVLMPDTGFLYEVDPTC